MNKFVERLRETMTVQELSQGKLAKLIGVRQQTVSQWLQGKNEPAYNTLLKICLALNVDPNYLLGYDELR